jgi:hypothetical protein
MPINPNWVRRNHFAAWSGYFCLLATFATLAMTLTAAASGHTQWALICGILCALTVVYGITVITTTVHRDHADHHSTPNLLADKWDQTPRALRRTVRLTPVRARHRHRPIRY